ncbi:UDP-N-acetylglucosamine diphosphorylase/glucosamine-1-phosphate N-acetyltransferase [Candidatus Methanoperedens nitroreducens]|uniref:Bifunctional protein GlmU n=1 Tax=Candidatus Methanoperedens nitratireducens TaxID=1392998 RepID=A0A062V9E6_9EURY|nr:bifunctional sugar-1-phosphate nucleotidylyltransferase/acetyltransferase [Candidatus Methanoperedens nitroreducens]KCZ73178.1 UDP-N-acetylglucosamine diphosphorylase/glucosamine-1-phosphate N-acetyltransferase [Candidatus Methanoperedens nitroreducens]MDJ1422873.1 sugar phosphate nucleotidyltransferase [Candidatus Methanoperedens sp.]
MKAVILAAGKGTRMGPLTESRPKVMLPIDNRPILEHIIVRLKAAGIKDFLVVIGYCKEKITDYFGDGSMLGVGIEYIEQQNPKGTADAIATARDSIDERFLVTNGDVLADPSDIKKIISAGGDAVLAAKRVAVPEEYGILYVKGNKVEKIVEKPKESTSDLANAGIYVFEPVIFNAIDNTNPSPRGEYEITDSIQFMIDRGNELSCAALERWQDIGFPWHLLTANEIALNEREDWDIQGEIEPYVTLKGKVAVGKGTVIRSGAYITGPVVIGENCDIGPNCFIRPGTSIADNVRIGNAVEVKNSIVMSGTNIGHLSYVGDSIIGEKCNFGAGTKVANLRHDNRTVMVELGGRRFNSGRRKLGVIMGDDVHTGINSMINVGTTIASGAFIDPGEFIKGTYPANR